MLIKSTDDLIKFVSVDGSTNIDSVTPYLKQSERQYILPILGIDLRTALDTAYNTGTGFTADLQALWNEVNICNANLAWYLYLPTANIRMSEKGLVTSSTGETQQITKWMFDKASIAFKQAGYNGIDSLYAYLERSTSADWYSTWTSGSGFSGNLDILVKNAAICSNLTPVNGSRWIYSQLRPILKSIEQTFMRPNIGAAFFDDLKTKFKANDASDPEKSVIAAMQDIISLLAYAEGVRDPNLRQEIAVMQGTQMDAIPSPGNNRADVDNRVAFDRIAEQYAAKATRLMDALYTTLNAGASDSVFPLYFTSTIYKDPTDQSYRSVMSNDSSKTFWMG